MELAKGWIWFSSRRGGPVFSFEMCATTLQRTIQGSPDECAYVLVAPAKGAAWAHMSTEMPAPEK